ncbi:MAG: sensor histidine kinase [Pseudomonadota bacterium]
MADAADQVLDKGTLSFTIESRILRELGERLVKQPEVALLELVKNSYDADATTCSIEHDDEALVVSDNGAGMTIDQFVDGWMRIGTSAKENINLSKKYRRLITGEKGIGRFAVRFLGRTLSVESIADDPKRRRRTKLIAEFDWTEFDKNEDIGRIKVPYRIEAAARETTGTKLTIGDLRPGVTDLDLKKVRSGSIGILSPLRSLFRQTRRTNDDDDSQEGTTDPGFSLEIGASGDPQAGEDVAARILDAFVLRTTIELKGDRLDIRVYRRGARKAQIKIIDRYSNHIQRLSADIRFFPRRKGAFTGLGVDGRTVTGWISENAGVAVFDRGFRVHPYGTPGDDWLSLAADAARNRRDPRSAISTKHFSMTTAVRASTSENWMLRLPQPAQLVGIVRVEGSKSLDSEDQALIASADREGFVDNNAFRELVDIVRGAAELIAVADRELQQEEEKERQRALRASIRAETRSAINEIEANPRISASDKNRIVAALAETQKLAEHQERSAKEREQQLEVMSLLGVVAGFMTHEFGVALKELEDTLNELAAIARKDARFKNAVENLGVHIKSLRDFTSYSQGYIQGAKSRPEEPYPARPRLLQVKRVFGKYAEERNIAVEVSADTDVLAPLVPPSLYNGIALNLFTNALKAVTAKVGKEQGRIALRAWNESDWHYLEVSDNGVGIPAALQHRVFDPLFSTTQSRQDPLGSGMGLGLSLVKRGAEAFGGRVDLVSPPSDFATCVRVRLPLDRDEDE